MLNVMTNRLSRVIDRGRFLTERPDLVAMFNQEKVDEELVVLEKRRYNTSLAITMCTVAALLICLVIVAFVLGDDGYCLQQCHRHSVSLAILALVAGLTLFLKEVHLASQTIRIITHSELKRK